MVVFIYRFTDPCHVPLSALSLLSASVQTCDSSSPLSLCNIDTFNHSDFKDSGGAGDKLEIILPLPRLQQPNCIFTSVNLMSEIDPSNFRMCEAAAVASPCIKMSKMIARR